MRRTTNEPEQNQEDRPSPLSDLLAALASEDGSQRLRARRSLVSRGEESVPVLIAGLSDHNWRVRWESAKALEEIASPAAAPSLVKALEDDRPGIRWLAAEGLIVLGRKGLKPLLAALIRDPDSIWLREGAHHIFRVLSTREDLRRLLDPLLKSLEDIEPELEVIPAAYHVMETLK